MTALHARADRRSRLFLARRGAPLALAALLFAGVALPAAADELGPLTKVSERSPFSDCTADRPDKQDGTLYRQTAIEPWIEANPADERNLIAGWQQDRWSNGGARGNVAGVSTDGGRTWRNVVLPKTTSCTGGRFKRASDPWLSISPDGTAFFMSLAFDPDLPSGAFGPNAMLVNRSQDGGRTWSNPITLIEDKAGQILNDKNSITADPTDSRFAYAVWDRIRDFTIVPPDEPSARTSGAAAETAAASGAKAGAGDGVVAARRRARLLRARAAGASLADARAAPELVFKGPTYLARTTDGGKTWKPATEIYDPGRNAQTIANQIVVLPNGTVIDFFTEISPNGRTRIGLIKSTNKGASWSRPGYAVSFTANGVVTPNTEEPVRDGSILFDVAVDPDNGNLYLVWQDARFNGVDQVAFSQSTDNGDTWSVPIRIDKTPNNGNELRKQAFVPSIAVGADGRLVVTYYDFRFDGPGDREATDYWAVSCEAIGVDCRKPSNWGRELRLTTKSFNIRHAPEANGYFLGDYMGLVAVEKRVYPAFGIAEQNERTDVFTRRIRLTGPSLLAEGE